MNTKAKPSTKKIAKKVAKKVAARAIPYAGAVTLGVDAAKAVKSDYKRNNTPKAKATKAKAKTAQKKRRAKK